MSNKKVTSQTATPNTAPTITPEQVEMAERLLMIMNGFTREQKSGIIKMAMEMNKKEIRIQKLFPKARVTTGK